jgi:hypothetical protein
MMRKRLCSDKETHHEKKTVLICFHIGVSLGKATGPSRMTPTSPCSGREKWVKIPTSFLQLVNVIEVHCVSKNMQIIIQRGGGTDGGMRGCPLACQ